MTEIVSQGPGVSSTRGPLFNHCCTKPEKKMLCCATTTPLKLEENKDENIMQHLTFLRRFVGNCFTKRVKGELVYHKNVWDRRKTFDTLHHHVYLMDVIQRIDIIEADIYSNSSNPIEWIQCYLCNKWRIINIGDTKMIQNDEWCCSMNTWDGYYAKCEIQDENNLSITSRVTILYVMLVQLLNEAIELYPKFKKYFESDRLYILNHLTSSQI